jgi:cytoskeletal protein CcmA (bactofilin family)
MLLIRLRARLRATTASGDRGFAIGAVVVLMAVSILFVAVMSSSVVYSIGFSTATRAGVQAQGSAEAGLAAATVGLETGTCTSVGAVYQSAAGTTPVYRAVVYVPGGAGWVQGCPAAGNTNVRIVSAGTAINGGTAGQRGNDAKTLETVLGPSTQPTQISATGPAVYAYSSSNFGGSGTLVSVDGSSPKVMISTGDVNCNGASSGASDLVVKNGNLTMSGSCSVTGNVWASGALSVNGGVQVGGNAVANSISIPSGAIRGSAWSASTTSLSGGSSYIYGNLTSTTTTFNSGGYVGGNIWNYGTVTLDWGVKVIGNATGMSVLNTNRPSTLGSYTQISTGPGASPYAQPATPGVPNWVDYNYDPTAWTGFTPKVLPTGTCTITTLQNAVTSLAGGKGLIDARNCSNGLTLTGSDQLQISNDIAIFANKIVIGNSGGIVPSAAARVWLINPDTTANGVPTCAANESFSVSGAPVFQNASGTIKDSVMMYSPCDLTVSTGVKFQGQVFAGSATIDGGAQIGYVAIGLPGVDLSTGTTTGGGPTTTTRSIVSNRNYTGP